ncbi:MAG TPA: hypothetical protein VMB81_15675 [Candidatus Sulfotelmatobacter sp.]|nr:hypothetical protein [Candidatus Sulfotelmatobacter sp.]
MEILPQLAEAEPGVYLAETDGRLRLVHLHRGEEYALTDIIEFFELGTVIEELAVDIVEFDRKELRELKAMVDAYRADYPPEFIEMCLDVHRDAIAIEGDTVRFYSNF